MTERNTVTYVRRVERTSSHTKHLWRVVGSDNYVLTSSLCMLSMFINETGAFWATSTGKIESFLDLAIVGAPEAHTEVLECAGFNIDPAGLPAELEKE